MSNCIAAMATAPGKASLCSIRISGDNAFEIAAKVEEYLQTVKKPMRCFSVLHEATQVKMW